MNNAVSVIEALRNADSKVDGRTRKGPLSAEVRQRMTEGARRRIKRHNESLHKSNALLKFVAHYDLDKLPQDFKPAIIEFCTREHFLKEAA